MQDVKSSEDGRTLQIIITGDLGFAERCVSSSFPTLTMLLLLLIFVGRVVLMGAEGLLPLLPASDMWKRETDTHSCLRCVVKAWI